jgi:hypothetical protein
MGTICDKILAQDRRIGFAMVVDAEGEIVESRMRGPALMPKEDIAAFAGMWTAIIRGVGTQMEKYFGRFEVNSLGYEKLNVHGIPVGNRTVVVTATKDLPLDIILNLNQNSG